MEYKDTQYPTRQDMRNEIRRLNDMVEAVTAVCNGSSAMQHLDKFRNADAILQETNNERLREALEVIADNPELGGIECSRLAAKTLTNVS